ncbi:RNA polymerase II C-terminal domain phosphatase-like 3 [Hibiscus syriacus]|uniref:RNA polymerase II C-terminal domain phosphatase-like 3 n=1 Tax=Hibiscus syriacus TaxID=106335 RepID=UPI0019224902|nr:RNA polymerase II C-terminal domain phosphatase-like 3 [Hibiscus syriacus]
MANDEIKMEDVEEGEISDSASIEEISEEDFNKQEVTILKESKSSKGVGDANSNTRVWTMQDLYKYPSVLRGYSSGLYNLAWAQAVQKKPFNEIFGKEGEQPQQDENNNSKRSSPSSSVASVNSKEEKGSSGNSTDRVVIDDSGDEMDEDKVVTLDKEEGELEEGEIDLDSEPLKERGLSSEDGNAGNSDELKKRANLIRGVLEGITVIEAKKSFGGVCSILQNALESLPGLVFESSLPSKDTLIELAFGAVNSAFVALNVNVNEQNVSIISRLLSVVKGFDPPLFPPDKMKEIEVMLLSLHSPARVIDTEKEIKIVNNKDADALAENVGHDLTITNKLPLSVDSESYNRPNMSMETLKPGVPNFRNKGLSLPLLDLHKDHDADSLPSPTRETTPYLPSLPIPRPLTIGDSIVKSGLLMTKGSHDAVANKLHPYETDALKAFSSYQQKFGRGSFFSSDRLPSPTPSEDSGDEGGDNGAEVSSSSSIGNFKPSMPVQGHPIVSSPPFLDTASSTSSMQGQLTSSMQGPISTQNATLVTVSSASNIGLKASAKSRDPRLRFANSNASALDLNQRPLHNASKALPVDGITDSRKKKSVEEPVLDGPALKRQKNELVNFGVVRDHVQAISGNCGWLGDTDNNGSQMTNRNQNVERLDSNSRKMEYGVSCSSTLSGKTNMTVNKIEQVPLPGMSTPSLPALLKDIAVNPTMLINILKMGQQQRLASETQQKSPDPVKSTLYQPSSNPVLGVVPPGNVIPSPSVNIVPSSSSATLSKPAGNLQVPPPEESGKIRMKPRDPRRVLHGNVLQKSGSVGSDQIKTNGISATSSAQGTKDNMNTQKQLENQTEAKAMHSQLVPPPDITQQFTQSLKNIAGMMSASQPFTSLPVASQNIVSQPIQVKSDSTDMISTVSNSEDRQTRTGAASDGVANPPPQNKWGDVEHLFERYDDRQKAAIQRERVRRLEEQKKMFAARKLCLVLDLDHTLLNSAKFIEVDPVHEEILRKKEEQDREKLQRHLFRFNHMGMWTKLRPGVWNFLEKASKLYELHLYTMGNKLYATEMAKVLDPKGVLFAGRVISRGDDGDPFDGDERVPRSKDLEGVLGMESSVVIIDDSVRVWPHNKLNLIVVERYTYFPCSRRQFGLLGPSLLEIDHDERPEDGTLASSLAVIERIHQNFFSHENLDDVDVRNILATEQRKILSGCRIVFSRVFPVGEANPHLHPLWQTAEQFGAVCTNQIDEHVTHVVANSLGTDKVNWALSTGKFVVHPGWVEASALLYRRANEHDFAIKP